MGLDTCLPRQLKAVGTLPRFGSGAVLGSFQGSFRGIHRKVGQYGKDVLNFSQLAGVFRPSGRGLPAESHQAGGAPSQLPCGFPWGNPRKKKKKENKPWTPRKKRKKNRKKQKQKHLGATPKATPPGRLRQEYQFDGFRFDGITSMLYHSHGRFGGFFS